MSLNERQKRHLRGLAHHLKPVVIVGQSGLTAGVLAEASAALEHHELIKVKINADDRGGRQALVEQIRDHTHATLIHTIGSIAIYYRPNPKKKRPLLTQGAPDTDYS